MDFKEDKFYIFVARDREEFKRYSTVMGSAKPFAIKDVSGCYRQNGNYVTLVLSEAAKYEPDKVDRICNYAASSIIFLSKSDDNVKDIYPKLTDPEDKVVIFVHWGGDGWKDKEKIAQQRLKDSAYCKWSIFALSSRRTNIGFMPGGAPPSGSELDVVVHNCKDAQSDKILAKWALGAIPAGDDWTQLEDRFTRLKNRIICSSLNEDAKKNKLKDIQIILDIIKKQDATQASGPKFLAKVLNKEVFNG